MTDMLQGLVVNISRPLSSQKEAKCKLESKDSTSDIELDDIPSCILEDLPEQFKEKSSVLQFRSNELQNHEKSI